jgi:diguanylate cyclase (GGDEF)-like protein/PAS domain S-box-containing protein
MRTISLSNLISSLSVRSRTVALALTPFIGLLAIGIAYTSGERQIATAFTNMANATELADASRDFRRAVETMHGTARDFVAHPDEAYVRKFRQADRAAFASLGMIAVLDTSADRDSLDQVQQTVAGLSVFFASLVETQRQLGYDELQGLRSRMQRATSDAETLIKEQLAPSQEVNAARLLASLQAMRRVELQFVASHDELDIRVQFFAELGNFNGALRKTSAAGGAENDIRRDMADYTDAFRELMSLTGHVGSFLAAIDDGTQRLMPVIDRLVSTAHANNNDAMQALTQSRMHIAIILIIVAGLAVIVAVGLSSLIGLGINMQNLRFDAALSNMSQGLCMFDARFRVVVCNRRYREIFGLSAEVVRPGMTIQEILRHSIAVGNHPSMTVEQLFSNFVRGLRPNGSGTVYELRKGRTVSISHRPMANGGWVGTYEDITERRRAEGRIAYLAHHDALTGLPNRVLFRDNLQHALARVARGEQVAVLCLDLDHFKSVNDTLGHPVGDVLLCAVTARLQALVRDTDTISRLGGDEFTIIQTKIGGATDVTALVGRVIDSISEPYDVDGHQVVIGVSIGIALAPQDGEEPDLLLRNADMALYRAKADGRGAYRFFEPSMDARMQARRALELDLRKALHAGEFELYYQPMVNARNCEVSGFEALLRWRHPERGVVSPTEFIPLAEEIGLIVPIGEWVIHQACQEAASWPGELTVAVNLSPVQFRSRDLVERVRSALAVSGLPAARLELEITESVLLQETDATLAILHQFRSLGVRISMDDFGTGYSSLSYLRSFPFDKIKIDKSFVQDLSRSSDCLAIVRAVTGLAGSLGIATVAEGVETKEQLDRLQIEGCTEVQGYLFSPPTSAGRIRSLLDGPLKSALADAA